MRDISPARPGGGLSITVSPDSRQRIRDALDDVLAPATRRAYKRQWESFASYCDLYGYQALPANVDVVCEYLQVMEGSTPTGKAEGTYKVGTIDQAATAIKYVHRAAVAMPPAPAEGEPVSPALWEHPQLRNFMKAMRNRAARQGTAEPDQEQPLMLNELAACVATARDNADTWRKRLHERRDSAVLLMGWTGGMRRSEITGLRVRDVQRGYTEWTMTVRRSKTDQAGRGQTKAMPTGEHLVTCAPCGFTRWMEAVVAFDRHGRAGLIRLLAGTDELREHVCRDYPVVADRSAPVFRSISRTAEVGDGVMSDEMVGTILRRRLAATDLAVDVYGFGAHSLRAGLVTESMIQGKDERSIMRQTGHRSSAALHRYARERNAYDNNAVTSLGL